MKPLGIAIWGLGRHALNRILPSISRVHEISLIGVCSRSEKNVKEAAKKWNCYFWTDPTEMLDCVDVDVVYISTPIGVHFELTACALIAGKHVWCEKPLTCSLEDSKKLVSIAKKNNKMLVENFMYLYHPQFDRVLNYINNNGKIYSVICRFGMPLLEEPGFRNNKNLGGGAFWDIASYPVSAVVKLFANQNVKILFSEIFRRDNSSVDNAGRAILRFSKGPTAYLEWGVGIGYKNEIDIWSEKGSFFTDKIFSKPSNFQTKYQIRDLKGNENIETGAISEQFEDMLHFFYDVYYSSDLIKKEYQSILDRARIMDQIINDRKLSD